MGHCFAGGWSNSRGFTVPSPPMQSALGHRKHAVMPKLSCGVGELPLNEISTERHPAHQQVAGSRSYLSLVSTAEQLAYQLLRMSGGHSRNCKACMQSRAAGQRPSRAPPQPAWPSIAAGLGSSTGTPQLLVRPALLILGYWGTVMLL